MRLPGCSKRQARQFFAAFNSTMSFQSILLADFVGMGKVAAMNTPVAA